MCYEKDYISQAEVMRSKLPGNLVTRIRKSRDTHEALSQDSRDLEITGLRATQENHVKLG